MKRRLRFKASFLAAALLMTGLSGCGKKEDKKEDGGTADTGVSYTGFDIQSERIRNKADEINRLIDQYFYFEKDPEVQEEEYFDGIMAGLDDPYSVYYTPEEYADLQEDDSGTYVGIGATVSKNTETNQIYIVKPLRNSPALEAGLLPGDVLIELDGTEVTPDMELEAAVKIIRGVEGTDAHIKVYREGEKDYLDFTITRAKVENITVEYEMLENDIGYIQVTQFIDNTPDQFKEGIDYLIEEGAKALVIDLRDNPGGLLTAVIEMTDYIVDDSLTAEGAEKPGLLLNTKDKNGTVIETYSCTDGHKVDLPMAVLTNGNSASASEIFTGVMKDYRLGVIVGTNTFGKGIVQTVLRLSDGSGIKFTVAKYFTPSGADIHETGIAPDVEIELDEDLKKMADIPHDEDNQLQKAIEELSK